MHPCDRPCCDQLTAVKTVYPQTSITWKVSRAQVSTHWVRVFFWNCLLTSYYFSNDRRLQFNFFTNAFKITCVHVSSLICSWTALLKFWFQTDLGLENSAAFYMQGRHLPLTFLTMVTRWSRSSSNFYAVIGQNLTSEFMRKIYAASGNLFSDSWSWQSFVSPFCHVFNCIFPLEVQNENSCYQDSLVIHGWFVYWVHGWEMRRLSKSSEIQFRNASFSFFTLFDA